MKILASWAPLVPLSFLICSLCTPADSAFGAIQFTDFGSTAGLSLVGDAAQSGSALRVSTSAPDSTGAAWYSMKQNVQGGFETTFSFRITDPVHQSGGEPGGDGFAFVIQNTSNTELGNIGFYMGYEIANSLAVEFDTFNNNWWSTAPAYEPNNNHIGVQSRGTAVNTASYIDSTLDAYMGHVTVSPNMSDGSEHTAKIAYATGDLSIYVDDLISPALSVSVDLDTLLNLDAGTAYVGFTAGGDTAYENHDITQWSFTSTVPEPSTLSILGGLLGMCLLGQRWRMRSYRV